MTYPEPRDRYEKRERPDLIVLPEHIDIEGLGPPVQVGKNEA